MDLQRELAPALSILCQGYLVTFSTEHGVPNIDESDPLYVVVNRALDLIEWQRLSRSSDVTSHSKVDFLQKSGSVMRLSRWTPRLEATGST
jgi:hypothetical protein